MSKQTTYQQIGRRIRAARRARDLIQTDVGLLLSRRRSHAAISDIERGKTQLDVDELTDMARVLHVTLAHLLGIDDPTEDDGK